MKPDLPAIRKRLAEATEGPWEAVESDTYCLVRLTDKGDDSVWSDYMGWPDATFIAHARTDVEGLLEEVERLKGVDQDLDVLRMSYDEKVRLLEEVAPALLSDPDLWDTMKRERDEALAEVRERWSQIEQGAQLLDEIIVAAGSLGLMPSELPDAVRGLRTERDEALAKVAELEAECAVSGERAEAQFDELLELRMAVQVARAEIEAKRERAEQAEAEVAKLRTALNALLTWDGEGQPYYVTENGIPQQIPDAIAEAVKGVRDDD